MSRSDHLVGADDKRLRKGDTERFCYLEIKAGLSGHVADSGAVQASVSTSGTQVTAFGNLAGSAGRGQWNTRSNDGTCAGYWTARAAAR